MNFQVPPGLTTLLQDFTIAVLRERPTELVSFAADYFNNLNSDRVTTSAEAKGVSFGADEVESTANEPMQTDSEDDEPFEPPKIDRFSRRKSVAAERYDPEADEDESEPRVVHPKSDDQRRRLGDAVKTILLFRALDEEQMTEVLDAMFERKVEPGDHIIDQGDDGDNFYVIDSGTYDIYVKIDGKDKNVGSYDGQGSFGELALMYNMPRAATIIATSEGAVWAMDRNTFRRIVLKSAYNKRKLYEALLENVPMLKTMDPYERMNVADALIPKQFPDGEQIIKQGDSADCMYFIEDGEVVIRMRQQDVPGSQYEHVVIPNHLGGDEEVEVSRCRTGQYFGELALVTNKPRAASVYAVGNTKCAVLDVNAFERLLGPCMELMKRSITDYEDQLVQVFGSKTAISDLR